MTAKSARTMRSNQRLVLPVGVNPPTRGWVLWSGNVELNCWVRPNSKLGKQARTQFGNVRP